MQWYERERDAAHAWGDIIADEIALLEGLRTEGPKYGSLSRHGDDAQRRAERFRLMERRVAALEEDALKRLSVSRSQPENTEREKALETEWLVLNQARVALEEERLTLEFVLLNTGRQTLAQIQKRQEEQAAAFHAYYQRYREEYLRDMQIGGAFIGGIFLLGALADALKSTEELNRMRRRSCEQMGGAYVIPGDPRKVLGHCVECLPSRQESPWHELLTARPPTAGSPRGS